MAAARIAGTLLDDAKRTFWRTHGWVVVHDALAADVRARLASWVDELSRPPSPGDRRMHYFESTAKGRALCRTERFIEDHRDLASLVRGGTVPAIAETLLGEPVRLYKEKVNYKAPGGAGFAAHQDATAYPLVRRLVTCLVAVDAMSHENGCIEFARYSGRQLLPGDGDGCLDHRFASALAWQAVEASAGSLVFFTAYVPHRSGPNRSDSPRRALYVTYNAASEGDLRGAYYDARERSLARTPGHGARISTIGHFQGTAAAADDEAGR